MVDTSMAREPSLLLLGLSRDRNSGRLVSPPVVMYSRNGVWRSDAICRVLNMFEGRHAQRRTEDVNDSETATDQV